MKYPDPTNTGLAPRTNGFRRRFLAWGGTPDDLVRVAESVAAAVPTGTLSIEVEDRKGRKRDGSTPGSLAELKPRERLATVSIWVSTIESHPEWALVMFGRGSTILSGEGKTARDAAAIKTTIEDAIALNVPGWAKTKVRRSAPSMVASLLVLALIAIDVATFSNKDADATRFAIAGAMVPLAFWLIFGPRLMPGFEIHEGRSRLRRFGWQAVKVVGGLAATAVIGIAIWLATK